MPGTTRPLGSFFWPIEYSFFSQSLYRPILSHRYLHIVVVLSYHGDIIYSPFPFTVRRDFEQSAGGPRQLPLPPPGLSLTAP